jgi:hypothetical protein
MPAKWFRYKVDLRLGRDVIVAVTQVSTVDRNNDGRVDGVATGVREVMANIVRETSVTFTPHELVDIKAGRMPIPFTSTAQSPDTTTLFVNRAAPNSVFISDDDLGAMVVARALDYGEAKVGVFNGTGLGVGRTDTRGLLYLARVDITPLGSFSYDETRPGSQPFRLALGGGVIANPYTDFDGAGLPFRRVLDLRVAGSLRVAVAGLSLGAEMLWRVQTDSFSSRPTEAYGGYLQLGYTLPWVTPIARVGATWSDVTFEEQRVWWGDAGLHVFPMYGNADESKRRMLRITAAWAGEFRLTDGESAQGVDVAAQVQF